MTGRLKQHAVGKQVRELRRRAGLTLRTLAVETGFSASFVSQLERGPVSPSIHSMEKIAGSLGTTLAHLFAGAEDADGGLVMRARDRKALNSFWSRARVEALAAGRGHGRLEPMLVTLRARGRSGKHPVAHATEEFAFVLQGHVRLRLGPDELSLGPHDAVVLRPGELRLWVNPGRKPARVLIVGLRAAAEG